jgi:uroporphyrin-III C-methyltransferase
MPTEQAPTARGMVYLVGAGPGPADLLTLRAMDRLKRAEVLVYDRLIEAEVLALAPPDAQRIYVGKAAGDHVMPQEQIHAVLIEQARAGHRVVRLKGGDPYLFGRGGEEVQALRQAGIAFEVVPGISAANGCAATAGIPLTHRHMAHSCSFLPGHLADERHSLDWAALAKPRQTRVFYMGAARLPLIARQLIDHGLPRSTPAAIVYDGTRSRQHVLACGLGRLAQQTPAAESRPGLLIVGETVALSPCFDHRHAD